MFLKQRRFYLLTEHKHFHHNTFYLFNLTITCLRREYVISGVTHNVTALFINIIPYQWKGYIVRQLRTKLPDKE